MLAHPCIRSWKRGQCSIKNESGQPALVARVARIDILRSFPSWFNPSPTCNAITWNYKSSLPQLMLRPIPARQRSNKIRTGCDATRFLGMWFVDTTIMQLWNIVACTARPTQQSRSAWLTLLIIYKLNVLRFNLWIVSSKTSSISESLIDWLWLIAKYLSEYAFKNILPDSFMSQRFYWMACVGFIPVHSKFGQAWRPTFFKRLTQPRQIPFSYNFKLWTVQKYCDNRNCSKVVYGVFSKKTVRLFHHRFRQV